MRNNAFDARDTFKDISTARNPTAKIAAYHQNQFGATFGGPIKHDRTFIYGGYSGWRYSKPTQGFSRVPTAAELNGDFTANSGSSGFKDVLPIYNPYSTHKTGTDSKGGRYRVLAGFKEHGVDVSSEALRYAFIGKVTWFNYADGLSRAKCPFGGEPVPILPLVYRKVTIWGGGGRALPYPDRILDSLFWNTAGRIWLTKKPDLTEVADLFYLVMVPWFKVQSLGIESFRRGGDDVTIGLEGHSEILLNDQA